MIPSLTDGSPCSRFSQLRSFGFGDRTQVDCPGESMGSLANYRNWSVLDTDAIAFGQGISVTAMQLVTAASALANDGVLMRPVLIDWHGIRLFSYTVLLDAGLVRS